MQSSIVDVTKQLVNTSNIALVATNLREILKHTSESLLYRQRKKIRMSTSFTAIKLNDLSARVTF